MKSQTPPPDDNLMIRCPRLGHQIGFSYCRFEAHGLPCFKILDCWHSQFPIEDFLRQELSSEDWEKAFCQPVKPKTSSLVELIEQAKQRNKEET